MSRDKRQSALTQLGIPLGAGAFVGRPSIYYSVKCVNAAGLRGAFLFLSERPANGDRRATGRFKSDISLIITKYVLTTRIKLHEYYLKAFWAIN